MYIRCRTKRTASGSRSDAQTNTADRHETTRPESKEISLLCVSPREYFNRDEGDTRDEWKGLIEIYPVHLLHPC